MTINSGPLPPCSCAGFSTGPDRPKMAAATASIRRSSNHHGVRSDRLSSSFSPNKSVTAGNGCRFGAGGMARSNNHRIGKTKSPSSSHGLAKPMPAIMVIGAAPMRDRATADRIAHYRLCGAGPRSSLPRGTIVPAHRAVPPVDPDTDHAERMLSMFRG